MNPHDRLHSAPGRSEPLPDAIAFALLMPPAPPAPSRRGGSLPSTAKQKLTRAEIGHLIALAKRAYEVASAGESFDDWRHEQSIAAVGCRLSVATRAQFRDLKSHFLRLAGDHPAARQNFAASGPNPRAPHESQEDVAQARWQLDQALARAGFHPNYARAIARRQFRVADLDGLTAHQLRCLRNTINNRRRRSS